MQKRGIEKIEEYFKIKLTGVKEITNINGLLHNILKDLPKQGDKVEFQNLILEVKELKDNRPNKVIIKKKLAAPMLLKLLKKNMK